MTSITFTPDFTIEEPIVDNVVSFPNDYMGPPRSSDEFKDLVDENKMHLAIDVAMESTRAIINGIESMGWDVSSHKKSGYEMALLVEVIKSMILRQQGIKHPLHDTIQDIMHLEEHDFTPEEFVEELMCVAID